MRKFFSWPRRLWLRIPFWILMLVVLFFVGRFAVDSVIPWRPVPVAQVPFLEHATTKTLGNTQVTVSALGAEESYHVFGRPLALLGIQPIWVKVKNDERVPLWYLRAGTDNEWYSPYEAYYANRLRAPREDNKKMEQLFYSLSFQNPVMPGETKSGFIFTRLDEGTKPVDIDVIGLGVVRSFSFQVRVPGFFSDVRQDVYQPDPSKVVVVESEAELRAELEKYPAEVTNKEGDKTGDPLNIVCVGAPQDVFPAFSRRGWHPTEQTRGASVMKTIRSALFGRVYLYSPVSPLYVYGRSQDLSAQKARGDVNMRNHLRLWLTPLRYHDKQVWLGQISRDIGVRVIWGIPPTTHKIDPDTDEARNGLTQDLAYSQALARFGFVKGVGAAPREQPRHNLTGDPFFTDGLRVVLFFENRPTTLGRIEMVDWERPPGMPAGSLFGTGGANDQRPKD